MIPSFTGQVVHSIWLDHALMIWTTDNWEFDLSAETVLLHPDGLTVIDTGTPQQELPAVLAELIGVEIIEVRVAAEGHLAVMFADAQLSVGMSADCEAWQLAGPNGERIVCMPGGELAIWSARND